MARKNARKAPTMRQRVEEALRRLEGMTREDWQKLARKWYEDGW